MKFRSIKYFFEEALKSVIRNRLMSVTSILTVASCVFMLIFSYCLAVNIDYMLEQFEQSIGLSVIMLDSATTDQIRDLHQKIKEIDNVENIVYITADEALETLKERLGDKNGIISGFENDNPLPRSFTLSLKDSRLQDDVISQLQSLSDYGIEKVINSKNVIEPLTAVNNIVRIISIIIVLVLGLLSVIIIMNTIKLTVNNRRSDIGIMKYVGATDWFIKWPFIIEGIIIGLLGAAIPVFFAGIGYNSIISTLESTVGSISRLFEFKYSFEIFPTLTPVMIVLGVFIGALGSMLSMRKYLDV